MKRKLSGSSSPIEKVSQGWEMSADQNASIHRINAVVDIAISHKYYLGALILAITLVLLSYLSGSGRVLETEYLSLMLITTTTIVFFLSGAVKGVAGIGMGLVAVPTMSVIFEPVLAVCVVAVPLVITNFWQGVIRAQPLLVFRRYRALFISMTVAMICSGYFANYFSVSVTSFVLGAMAVVFSLINLGIRLPRFNENIDFPVQIVCGVVAGFVGGMTGLVVIPLVLYMICRSVSKEEFVSALGLLLLVSGLVLVMCYGLNGAMTLQLFILSLLASVPALFGVIVGESIRQYLDDQVFRKIVLYMIMTIGVKILIDI